MEYKNISAVSFNIDNNIFLYDRYSNEFMKIDEVIELILDDYFVITSEEIINKYKDKIPENSIVNALNKIDIARSSLQVLTPLEIKEFKISNKFTTYEKIENKVKSSILQLSFATTENCNLRCKYCIYTGSYSNVSRKHNSKHLTLDNAKKAVDLFLKSCHNTTNDVKHITFYGGEPLLEFELIKEVVKYTSLRNSTIGFMLNSNLTLVTDEIIAYLVKNDFSITVSIDGPSDIHDRFRLTSGNKKTHEIVENNLIKIRNYNEEYFKKKVMFNVVLSPHDCDLNTLDQYFNKKLFDGIPFQNFKILKMNHEENSFYEKYNYDEFIKRYTDYAIDKFINAHLNGSADFNSIKISYQYCVDWFKRIYYRNMTRMDKYNYFWPNGMCIPGLRSIFVSANGELYPCESLHDHNSFVMGDVSSGINLNSVTKIIDEYCANTVKFCKKCWAYRLCGECLTSSRLANSYSDLKKSNNCNKIKKSILNDIINYMTIINKNPKAFDYLTDKDEPISLIGMSKEE